MIELSDRGEETLRLIKNARKGDRKAFEEAVKLNLPLVKTVAARFFGRGERDDLIQIGSIGLIKAVMRFDSSRGTRFSSYAVPLIAGEIKRYLRDDGSITVARRYKELSAKISAAVNEAEKNGALPPKMSEIASSLGISLEEAALALDACRSPLSIYTPLARDGEATLGDVIPDRRNMEACVIDRVAASLAIEKLEADEKRVVLLRFFRDLTQKETAERLGLTQVKVSRMEANIIKKLRKEMGEE